MSKMTEEEMMERSRKERMDQMTTVMAEISGDIDTTVADNRVRIPRRIFADLYLPAFANYESSVKQQLSDWINLIGGPTREAVIVDDATRSKELLVIPAVHSSDFLKDNDALQRIPDIVKEAGNSNNYGPHYVNNFLIRTLAATAECISLEQPEIHPLDAVFFFYRKEIEDHVPDFFKGIPNTAALEQSTPPEDEVFG